MCIIGLWFPYRCSVQRSRLFEWGNSVMVILASTIILRAEPSRAEPSLRPTCPPEPSAARRTSGSFPLSVFPPAGAVLRAARPGGSRRTWGLRSVPRALARRRARHWRDLSPGSGFAPGRARCVPARLTAVPFHAAPPPSRRVPFPASPSPSPRGRARAGGGFPIPRLAPARLRPARPASNRGS